MNFINENTSSKGVTKVLMNLISTFEGSELRQKMRDGHNYYRSENTEIEKRKMLIYAEDADGNPYEMEDPYKANNKLASGYLKVLVDQKVNYLLGKPVTIDSKESDVFWEIVGSDFQKELQKLGKEASKKAVAWLHPYLDKEGQFKYKTIPSEQVIAFYKPYDENELELVIRYYSIEVFDDGEMVDVGRVEVWDADTVTYYEKDSKDGLYYLLNEEQMKAMFGRAFENPKAHFQKDLVYGTNVANTKGLSWGRVPFIKLTNNDDVDYDLQSVKSYIDAYDLVSSDFINNFQDFQDLYWVLKGYDGENLADFLYQVKRYKTLKVSEDGDARSERIDIPFEARKEAKEGLEADIFTFGMGVNPNAIGDGNITNVVIQSRYALLDLKVSDFQAKIDELMQDWMYFVNFYAKMTGRKEIVFDNLTYNKSLIFNENEMLETNAKQKGIVSEYTRLSNHVWVDSVEDEKKLMEDELTNRVPDLTLIDDDAEGDDDGNEG